MKIIDNTPLLNEKGQLGFVQRIQGMLKFGLNWPNELQAQKVIVTYFDRQLEKGYTLIRNVTLGQSGIMVPIILLGPTGIYVIDILLLRGRYEVNGDSWNVDDGNGYKPAPVNVIQRTIRMTKAVKSFVERQGMNIPVPLEPVLIAGDPGLHIESVRPVIKVLMIDGIKSYVSGLVVGRPVLSTEIIHEITDRIIDPRPLKKKTPASPMPHASSSNQPPHDEVSRARAIFNASQDAKPFDPSDFDFAMSDETGDEPQALEAGGNNHESNPAQPLPRSQPRSKRVLGMTPGQLAIIGGLALLLLCVLVGFAYYYYAFILS